MKEIRAIIIDDMPLAIASLQADIEDLDISVEIIATAEGVMDAAKKIKKEKPDLIFLDIHMGDGDGFDLLDIIDNEVAVIFTTASKDFAIKAFQFSAIDYLLKPIDTDLLKLAVEKARASLSQTSESGKTDSLSPNSGSIALNTQEEIRLIKIADIIRLEAMGNYTTFYIEGQSKMLVTRTMKEFENTLPNSFLRTHQSHLVNKEHIKSYVKTEGGYLLLKDGSNIPVSVRKKSYVMDALSQKG